MTHHIYPLQAASGMAISCLGTGMLLQRRLFSPPSTMAIGAALLALGLFLTFPPPSLSRHTPTLAFLGVFLAGLGDPLMTLSTLRAMSDIQAGKEGELSAQTITDITGVWLIGYNAFFNAGPFLGGFMTDYMSYTVMGHVLSGTCLIALVFSLITRWICTKDY